MQNGVFKLLSIGIISHEKHFDHFIGHAHPRGSAPKVEEKKINFAAEALSFFKKTALGGNFGQVVSASAYLSATEQWYKTK